MSDIEKLRDLIGQYWEIAYREGSDGRQHDTEEGSAQECWTNIQVELTKLQAENEALRARAAELKRCIGPGNGCCCIRCDDDTGGMHSTHNHRVGR